MRIQYQQLKGHPNVLHSLTGLRPKEFEQLVADIRSSLAASERKRLLKKRPEEERKRAVGGGHPYALPVQEQILLSVMWLRLYPASTPRMRCSVSSLGSPTLPCRGC